MISPYLQKYQFKYEQLYLIGALEKHGRLNFASIFSISIPPHTLPGGESLANSKEIHPSLDYWQQEKDLQIKIALDDFGTGYSSLSYLTMFKVHTLKIDRSFVMGCTLKNSNLAIIKAIVAMANSLGMKIIAEGIETVEQFELLKNLGVQEGQGYLFKPPVPPEDFIVLLQKGIL